jgi:hypothetical protein
MGRLRSDWLAWVFAGSSLCFINGCGGSKPPGPSPFPAKITVAPSPSTSLQLGTTTIFTATAQNAAGTNISTTFTFQSSDTSILNIAPNGVGCAGRWDAAFTTCTAQGTGVVQVTASALGAVSAPTLVFVHPPIDNIQIDEVPPVNPPPPCPGQQTIPQACAVAFTPMSGCMSSNQVTTLEAKAFSNGVDITASVGPLVWSETSPSVAKVTPVTSTSDNTPTNQATVTPGAPGFTPVFASVSGISSQPFYAETCPVQCVALELGRLGSGQTSFAVNKGSAQIAVATAVDVQGCVVPKPPLTWSSSQPASVTAGSSASGCPAGTTCSVATPQPGAGSVTASCTPPTCNIGFPQSVVGLPQSGLVQPVPVYPVTPISGLVNGATSAANVLATSLDCASDHTCGVALFNISTSTNLAKNPNEFPTAPNSLLFDLTGERAFMGGDFGAQAIATGSLGTSNNAFTALGTVTGKVLAVSSNGSVAVFSDTLHSPNQVYVVNASGASSSTTALNISGATVAAFSPDGLKAFIIGCKAAGAGQCPNGGDTVYVYSSLQALQIIPLAAAAATGIGFSSNGAFAFVTGGAGFPAVGAYNVCNNSLALTIPMTGATAVPNFLKTLPDGVHLIGLDSTGLDFITTAASAAPQSPCPQIISASSRHIDLGQGTFNPVAFFVSPDGTLAYVVASDRSVVLVYDFSTGAVSGVPLAGNATPGDPANPRLHVADMTVDGTLIYVAGSDGMLHELSTISLTDVLQISFPDLNINANPFCTLNPTAGACKLDFVAVKP